MWPRDPRAASETLGAGRALPRVEKLTSLTAWCSLFIDGLTLESITSKTAVSGGAGLFEKIFILCFAVDLEMLKVLAGTAGTWDDSERQETCSRKELAGGGGGVSPEAFTHPPAPHTPVQRLPGPSVLDVPTSCQEIRGRGELEGFQII